MNKNIEKVIRIAEEEVGYKEGKTNITKYAKWFDTQATAFYNTKKQGAAWCDIFVDYCFCQAFGEAKAREMLYQPKKSLGAGCKYSAGYYRSNKAWQTEPQEGDQIFFGTKGAETHTGLVYKVTDKMVYTIEGNTENEVKKKSYQKSNKKIAGYGRPKWKVAEAAEKPAPAPATEKPTNSTPTTEKPKQDKPQPVQDTKKIIKASNPAKFKSEAFNKTYTVNAVHGLNLRDGAGKAYKIMTTMSLRSSVRCYGYYSRAAGEDWLLVSYEKGNIEYQGFCCKNYLE